MLTIASIQAPTYPLVLSLLSEGWEGESEEQKLENLWVEIKQFIK